MSVPPSGWGVTVVPGGGGGTFFLHCIVLEVHLPFFLSDGVSTALQPGSTEALQRWSCPECFCDNPGDVVVCFTCGAPRVCPPRPPPCRCRLCSRVSAGSGARSGATRDRRTLAVVGHLGNGRGMRPLTCAHHRNALATANAAPWAAVGGTLWARARRDRPQSAPGAVIPKTALDPPPQTPANRIGYRHNCRR